MQSQQGPERVRLAASAVQVLTESPRQGLLIDLTHEVGRRARIEFDITVLPVPRAVECFLDRDVAGMFPVIPTERARRAGILLRTGMCKRDFAFVRAGDPPVVALGDMAGRRIAYTRDYGYAAPLHGDPRLDLRGASSDLQAMMMLASGEVDMVVAEELSGLGAAAQANIEVAYAPDRPLGREDLFYLLRHTRRAERLASRIEAALASLESDGTLKRLFGSAFGTRRLAEPAVVS